MLERKRKNRYLLFLILVAFFTLCVLAAITLLSPRAEDVFSWRRPVTGGIFSLLCILGAVAVFFPQHCARRSQKEALDDGSTCSLQKRPHLQRAASVSGVKVMHGHHPTCDRYRQHEFAIGKKTLCSACLGLFCGALIALAGASYVFLLEGPYGVPDEITFALGTIGIALGLAAYAIADLLGPLRRFCFNAVMIIGMFLALVGIDGRVQSFALNALLICFFIFVIFVRIVLSQDKHERICAECETTVCDETAALRSTP